MKKISRKIGADLEDTAKVIKLSLFSDVIKNTRVDEGTARGNWQATDDSPATGTLATTDKNGDRTISAADDAISGIGVSYLTNNLPYIKKLEELDGMADKAVARIQRTIKDNV